jgi:hypothetical protein
MPDRADYLARLLLSRMRDLEGALLDDAAPDEHEDGLRRQELVAKVLVVEEGITDGPTVQLVASALPRVNPFEPTPDRDTFEFADFLRTQLWREQEA